MNYSGTSSSSGQVVSGIGLVAMIFIASLTAEVLYKSVHDARSRFQTLIDYSADSTSNLITIRQDASTYANAQTIGVSMNEATGIEFSYSFFILVDPNTFDGTDSYKHVFHKGSASLWPLMGPGVFVHGTDNTMRIVMNTYANPYKHVDITNIPINKWVHVVLNCVNNGLDVYVNGNLANRISFENTLPYQNFQDLILFSNVKVTDSNNAPVLESEKFNVSGRYTGKISSLIYARYGLSIMEIQNLLNKGPSQKVITQVMDTPPYLANDWWAQQPQ